MIENDIHVTVLDICQEYVRLAISSPNNSPPYREETLYWEEASRPSRCRISPGADAAVAVPGKKHAFSRQPREANRGGRRLIVLKL